LLTRRDVIVVASVSCIYGLGTPQEYVDRMVRLKVGESLDRDSLLRRLVDIQYNRNDIAFTRGTFRVRGDTIEVYPVYEEHPVRIEMFGDDIDRLMSLHPVTGEILTDDNEIYIFPASHYTAGPERMNKAISAIEAEVAIRIPELESQGKLLEAQRIKMRTSYDIEMMQNLGFCSGIENYSRHIDGREEGSAPNCLLDYFPEDFLLVIDESHVTVPQIGAMYQGDASRKRTLVEHGFRLPSAMDNRPLKWLEFLDRVGQTVYLSATPGPFELGIVNNDVVEQVIRPTGLVDPEVIVKPTKGQIDDLIHEIRIRAENGTRVLVTTLTKKMSECQFNRTQLLNKYAMKKNSIMISNTQSIPILFKSLHNPRFDSLNIHRCLELPEFLWQDPNTRLVFKNQKQPTWCLKRSPNLRDLLVRSRYNSIIPESKIN
jgi:excinuclease ABC subunit B